MPLKTFINGQIYSLTSTAKPPVTFVNGVKKKLTKGVTFINGQKVVLWDAHELQISYIDPDALGLALYYETPAFFANRNYILYSASNTIFKLNVTNKATPYLDGSIQLGNVVTFSSVDSSVATAVFYAANTATSGQTTFNQINVTNSTGAMVASNAQTINISLGAEGAIYTSDGTWLTERAVQVGSQSSSPWYAQIYEGDAQKYSYVLFSGGSLSGKAHGPQFTKLGSNYAVGRINIFNSTQGIAEYDASGYTVKVSGVYYTDTLVDTATGGHHIAVAGGDGFALYFRNSSGNYSAIATQAGLANHTERLVGKCRGYYYTVCLPSSSDTDKKYYLRVYTDAGVLYETRELTDLEGSRYNSDRITIVPQVSKTGYLTVYIPRYLSRDKSRFVLIECY